MVIWITPPRDAQQFVSLVIPDPAKLTSNMDHDSGAKPTLDCPRRSSCLGYHEYLSYRECKPSGDRGIAVLLWASVGVCLFEIYGSSQPVSVTFVLAFRGPSHGMLSEAGGRQERAVVAWGETISRTKLPTCHQRALNLCQVDHSVSFTLLTSFTDLNSYGELIITF